MLTTEMSPIIAAAQPGDTIVVRHAGGRPTTYKVRSIGGKKAREIKLDGRRGSMRVLVDGGDQIWIREASARASDGAAHRRVMELRNMTIAANEKRSPEQPRSTGMILRDMAIREAGLPPGYDIELHPRGFQAMLNSEPAFAVQESAYVAVCCAWAHWANGADVRADEAVLRHAALPPGYDVLTLRSEPSLAPRYVAALDEPRQPVVSPCTRACAVEAIVDAWAHHAAKRELVAAERWTCIVERAQADERLLLDLPRGYTIEPGDHGFYRAVFDDAGWIGSVRTSIPEAVVDALVHATEQLETALGRHRTTAIDRDLARADSSRCRRALRQIREIAKGTEPTGKELAHGEMPEQVVAEVGHALRVESRMATNVEADPDWIMSGFIPKLAAMADRRTQPYEKDPIP